MSDSYSNALNQYQVALRSFAFPTFLIIFRLTTSKYLSNDTWKAEIIMDKVYENPWTSFGVRSKIFGRHYKKSNQMVYQL